MIAKFCKDCLVELGLKEKIFIVLGGDHTNTNFIKYLHKGADNIYSMLKQSIDDCMAGVGCPASVLHNTT